MPKGSGKIGFSPECEEAFAMLEWGITDPRWWWSAPRELRAWMTAAVRARGIVNYYNAGGE